MGRRQIRDCPSVLQNGILADPESIFEGEWNPGSPESTDSGLPGLHLGSESVVSSTDSSPDGMAEVAGEPAHMSPHDSKNVRTTLSVWTRIFSNTEKKNLRFRKYPDMCGRGLRLSSEATSKTTRGVYAGLSRTCSLRNGHV